MMYHDFVPTLSNSPPPLAQYPPLTALSRCSISRGILRKLPLEKRRLCVRTLYSVLLLRKNRDCVLGNCFSCSFGELYRWYDKTYLFEKTSETTSDGSKNFRNNQWWFEKLNSCSNIICVRIQFCLSEKLSSKNCIVWSKTFVVWSKTYSFCSKNCIVWCCL